MPFLADTNIFLEILLGQEKSGECQAFLSEHEEEVSISDFSLHSVCVVLLRENQREVYRSFLEDVAGALAIRALPQAQYAFLPNDPECAALDFDDAYQYMVAKHFDLTLVTMDQDFSAAKDISVRFL